MHNVYDVQKKSAKMPIVITKSNETISDPVSLFTALLQTETNPLGLSQYRSVKELKTNSKHLKPFSVIESRTKETSFNA